MTTKNEREPMDPERFRSILHKLNMTQVGAAKFLDIAPRTSRRWSTGQDPVPYYVEILLELMAKLKMEPNHVLSLIGRKKLDGLNNPVGNPNWISRD